MTDRTLPGLGLKGYWALGEDGWKDDNDANLRLLSLVCQAAFIDFVSAEPGGPSDGDIYVFTDDPHANQFLMRDDGAWVYITARTGTIAYNQTSGAYYAFDGTNWNPLTPSDADSDYQDSVRIFTLTGDGNVDWETGGEITVQSIALEDGDRVGLGDQTDPAENLLYIVRAAGTWDRAEGWENGDPVTAGTLVPIEEGTFSGSLFQLSTPNPIDIGTTGLTWKNNARSGRTNFSGLNKSGDYTLTTTDNRRWIYLTKEGDQDVLLPTHADVSLPANTEAIIEKYSTAGTKTITADTGVFLNGVNGGSVELSIAYTAWWVKKKSKTNWVAIPLGVSTDNYSDEMAMDALAAAFAAGSHTGITITYNDVSDSFDFAVTITQYTDEMARDALGTALVGGTGITITPNDGADTITIDSTITQYTDELAQDAIAAAFAAGTHVGVTITYNDVSNSFDFASTGSYTAENARDDIGAALVGGTGITITPNDGADTITVATTITQYTDEKAQDALDAAFSAGSHTGLTITYNDVSNSFDFAVTITQYTDEMARDALGTALTAGTGIVITPNDGADTITIDSTITQYTDEKAQDALAAAFAAGSHTGLTITYTDGSDKFDFVNTITQYTDEKAQDALAAAFAAGSHTNLTITYNDVSNSFDFAVSGIAVYTAENARDDIGAALVGGTGITITPNDGADTITVEATYYREKLTGDRTYYVDVTLGNDANTGLSAGSGNAFATIAKAISVIYSNIDWNGYIATIQCADGTYAESISITSTPANAASIKIIGNTATPANCIINFTGSTTANIVGQVICTIDGFTLQGTVTNIIVANQGCRLTLGNIRFAGTATNAIVATNNSLIAQTASTTLTFTTDLAVGLAIRSASILALSSSGTIAFSGIGTRDFSASLLQFSNNSACISATNGFAFSGTMTGVAVTATRQSSVQLAGIAVDALPGSGLQLQGGSSYTSLAGNALTTTLADALNLLTANRNNQTTDSDQVYVSNSASDLTYTIRSNATVAQNIGTQIKFHRYGTGAFTIVAGAGVTFIPSGNQSISFQGGFARATKIATDTWIVSGNITSQTYTDEAAQDAVASLLAAGTHQGITVTYNDAGNALSLTNVGEVNVFQFIIDGGGATITTGIKGDIYFPYACTIVEWTLLADASGSIQLDLWDQAYGSFPATVSQTITASAKPLISSATKGQSSTLTGWTTAVAAGTTMRINVDSVTTHQRVTLALKVTRT